MVRKRGDEMIGRASDRWINTRGQEEIAGFMIIVVIVCIILLFFLVFSLQSERETESYEVTSFINVMTDYTSTCHNGREYSSIGNLIKACFREEMCQDESFSCDVLEQTLEAMIPKAWPVGPDFRYKGYKLEIVAENETMVKLEAGNMTSSYKGSQQVLPISETAVKVSFTVYY